MPVHTGRTAFILEKAIAFGFSFDIWFLGAAISPAALRPSYEARIQDSL